MDWSAGGHSDTRRIDSSASAAVIPCHGTDSSRDHRRPRRNSALLMFPTYTAASGRGRRQQFPRREERTDVARNEETSVTKTEAVKYLLTKHTHPDLAALYDPGLEVQVSVAQDGGDRVDKEFKGKTYGVWTDGRTEWKSFRIPRNADSDAEDNDGPMNFNLEAHVEGIGMTGWDWRRRVSLWSAYDFDSIVGHAEGHRGKLTDEELAEVKRRAMSIPWVTVRKSTGGKGIHLYVFLPDVPTANHTEHAAPGWCGPGPDVPRFGRLRLFVESETPRGRTCGAGTESMLAAPTAWP